MRDFRRKIEIIENISGSSWGSSWVAVGCSWVAVGLGQNPTATHFYYLKSTSYKKGSSVAVVFIQAHKTRFLLLFGTFLNTKNVWVAVDFLFKIFLFQNVTITIKINCYPIITVKKSTYLFSLNSAVGCSWVVVGLGQNPTATHFYYLKSTSYKKGSSVAVVFIQAHKTRFLLLFSLNSFEFDFLSQINRKKNILFVVNYCLLFIVSKVCIDKGLINSVFGFDCGFWDTWEKNSGKSGILIIALIYKKCGKGFFKVNKIKGLWFDYLKKSVVVFEKFNCLVGVLCDDDTPPLNKTNETLILLSYLLFFINCKDFLRVFQKWGVCAGGVE